MKAYVTTSGVLFALLLLAHIWRAIAEGPRLLTDPFYLCTTAAAAAMAVWAWLVRSKIPRS